MTRTVLLFTIVFGVASCGGDADGPDEPVSAGVGPSSTVFAATAGSGAAGASAGGSSAGAGSGGTDAVIIRAPDAAGSTASGSGGAGSSGAGDGGSGGTAASGTGGSGMRCVGPGATDYARPTLDKSCTVDDDCFAGLHLRDCCGNQVALAFNRSEQAAFDAYELSCGGNPPCECPSTQPVAEDGSALGPGVSAVAKCMGGTCLARPPDADECSGAMECIRSNGLCVEATGPIGNGACRGSSGTCLPCMCASPDTPIATPDGDKPIASLKVGDLVYSIDGASIRAVPIARVARLAVFNHRVVQVRLANGRTLEISPGHPTADGRLFAALTPSDQLGETAIVETELVDYAHAFTHDILPASSTGTYFAAGVPIGSTLF